MDLAEISQKRNSEVLQFFLDNFDLAVDFVHRSAIANLRPTVIGRNYWDVIEDICQEVLFKAREYFQHYDRETTQDPLTFSKCTLLRILKDVIRAWCRQTGIDYETATDCVKRSLEGKKSAQAIAQLAFLTLFRQLLRCGIDIQAQQYVPLASYLPPPKKKQRHQRKLSDAVAVQKLTSKDASHSLNTQVIKSISHCVIREKEMYVRGIYTPVSISSKAG